MKKEMQVMLNTCLKGMDVDMLEPIYHVVVELASLQLNGILGLNARI